MTACELGQSRFDVSEVGTTVLPSVVHFILLRVIECQINTGYSSAPSELFFLKDCSPSCVSIHAILCWFMAAILWSAVIQS
jgi:hypothetical protein